jgi:hypothetical protein
LEEPVFVLQHGVNDDIGIREFFLYNTKAFDAVHTGHTDVHDHDVGSVAGYDGGCLRAILKAAAYAIAIHTIEQYGKRIP